MSTAHEKTNSKTLAAGLNAAKVQYQNTPIEKIVSNKRVTGEVSEQLEYTSVSASY
jgi:hypothetical protein